jgi:hypothetical protein
VGYTVFIYIPLVNIKEFDLLLLLLLLFAYRFFIIDIPKTSCGLDLGIIKEFENVCCFWQSLGIHDHIWLSHGNNEL